MTRILLTGMNGQVGWELQRTLPTLGEVIALDRRGLDLADPDSIRHIVRDHKPDLIVNAAAYTAVDKAEEESDLAMAINGTAPGILAEEAKRLGAALVHYSTDYIFDGNKNTPYTEDDAPKPLNVYGKTKLAGEKAIHAVGVPYLIFRTSWVYGARGKNFLLTILRLARERDELNIVDDQIGSPTWCRLIAQMTAHVLTHVYCHGMASRDYSGIYHFTATGKTSWFEFASQILEWAKMRPDYKIKSLRPITTREYPTAAVRPVYSAMSNNKITEKFSLNIPTWQHMLGLCMAETGYPAPYGG
jgi:dTDP-4-dehydrorhamnose reductase